MPVIDCTAGELAALLVNDKEAEVAPLACGVKVTVKGEDWPGASVSGREIAESRNSPLFRLAEVIVTEAPLALRLPLSEELEPTTTLPKLRLVGETANWPAAVPVPERAILSGELDALDTTDRLPLEAAALVGVKVAVKVTLWFAVSVRGKVKPVMEKTDDPDKFACEMVIVDPPVLVRVSDKLALLPTCTFPKARLGGFAVSVPCVTPVPERGMLKLESEPVEVRLTLPLAAPLAVGEKSTVKDVLWPAVNVKGKDSPLKLNPAPLAEAAEIVRLVPPVLVRVSDKLELLPTCTLPNATLAGFAVSVPCVTPVPESGMLKLESEPVEVRLTLPLAAPLAVGEKSTLNEVLWPAVNVKGNDSPLKLNPAPLAEAAEIVRFDPPVLVRVSDKLELLPTCTLPNATLAGFAVSVPCVTPVPESGMLKLESEPVEVRLTLPLAAPLAVGEKSTLNEVLWPAVNVKGNDSPLKLNPAPLAEAAEIVRFDPPVLVRVSDKLELLPTCTLPNARLVGLAVSWLAGTPVPDIGKLAKPRG